MAEIVRLELPETLAKRAKEIAALRNRRIEDVLVEWISRASTELPKFYLCKKEIRGNLDTCYCSWQMIKIQTITVENSI